VERPVRVLIVEDSEEDALLLERALVRAGWRPEVTRVEDAASLRAALAEREHDAVISDWSLPRFSGMAALAEVHASGLDLPFILCSGVIDEEKAVSGMRAGAHDFVTKVNLARLAPALDRELREAADRRARRGVETELARTRVQLERAMRLEQAGTIASQVAHDVGNLLSPLVLAVSQLRRKVARDHPAAPLCDRLELGLARLGDLNRDLLTLGRRGGFQPEPTDLNAVVSETVGMLDEPPAALALEVALAPDVPLVAGCAAALARVVANLVSNGREAVGERGTVTIRTSPLELSAPRGEHAPGQYALLTVSDTGPGIPPERLERIFEPFYTTKTAGKRGTGLGLAIVQAIVRDHRGSIEVASAPGQGAVFSVILPARAAPR
jgi:signal transduction histidine kinase